MARRTPALGRDLEAVNHGRRPISRDARHVWHPYTQAATEPAPIGAVCQRPRLILDDGTELVDGISSWWATLHGHGERGWWRRRGPRWSGSTTCSSPGPPTSRGGAGRGVTRVAPEGLTRTFFSDDGSTAVEVALKIALQAHAQRDSPSAASSWRWRAATTATRSEPWRWVTRSVLHALRAVPLRGAARPRRRGRHHLGLGPARRARGGGHPEPRPQGAAGMRVHDASVVWATALPATSAGSSSSRMRS